MIENNGRRSASVLNAALGAVSALLTVAYPFAVYFFNSRGVAACALGLLCVSLGLKTVISRESKRKQSAALFFMSSLLLALHLICGGDIFVKAYPIAVNALLLFVFGSTLFWGEKSMVERIACLTVPPKEQTDSFKKYCRSVTVAWCAFFIFNGTVSAYTASECSDECWMIYNGAISYALIGLMFAGEYVCRLLVRRRNKVLGNDSEVS